MFGFYPGLLDTKEGRDVRHVGGQSGDEEDRVAQPQVGLPHRLEGREERWPVPGVEDGHLVQDFTGRSSGHQAA